MVVRFNKKPAEAVKCKFCGSVSIYHFGYTYKGQQRYLCTDCRRTFLDNKAPVGMRFSAETIASALNQFYESASLCKIQGQLQSTYRIILHRSTIYRWIIRYSQKAARVLGTIPIKASSNWIADETSVKLKDRRGSIAWFWDIMDKNSRFLLASYLSERRNTKDVQTLIQRAARRAGKIPRTIFTDKLSSYLDGIEFTFADTEHIPAMGLRIQLNINLVGKFHIAIKGRAKVVRSFMRSKTARVIMEGWLAHYNFFRPHSALGGKTPAEAAGAQALFRSWADVVNSE